MKLFELFATLELQTNKFEAGVNKVQGMAQVFANGLKRTVSAGTVALGHLLAKGAEAAADAVKNVASQALNLTGQLEQAVGGSVAVFGDWAENVQDKSAQAFKNMGLSASDYLATANQMGSLFKGAGFTTVEAFELTTSAMQRAADVASIMGIDAAWAMESIAGAAKGNFTIPMSLAA